MLLKEKLKDYDLEEEKEPEPKTKFGKIKQIYDKKGWIGVGSS